MVGLANRKLASSDLRGLEMADIRFEKLKLGIVPNINPPIQVSDRREVA